MSTQALGRPIAVDLHDRAVLLRSWLHTLHGPHIDPRPRTDAPLPPLRALLGNAVAWHVAYVLMALIGCLVIARSGSGSTVADALGEGGRAALAVGTLLIWWGGAAMGTALWWAGVQVARKG